MRSHRAVWALFVFLALPVAVPAQDEPKASPQSAPQASPIEANKDLVRRYLSEILSAGRLDQLDQFLSSDFVDSTPGASKEARGPEVVRAAQQRAREIFPEVSYTVEDLIAEGDKVTARYTVRATSRSEMGPGRNIQVTGVTIFRIADGKIRETWIINDQIEMFLQLGYTLQPPQTSGSR